MRWILLFLGGVALVMLPFVDAPMANSWLFRVSTLVILTISWNMMANAGLVSLGHAAFWGVGSYIGILTVNWGGVPFFVAL
jgi:branched-chain amino acid transport system permease protein